MRAALAETVGTLLLVATVIGSGIMGDRLAAGNVAVALLANTFATVCVLYVLITMLGPVSGAHFNPAVTALTVARGGLDAKSALARVVAQLAGGCLGAWLAHAMFGLSIFQLSTHVRTGPPQWLAELVATFGLVLTVEGVSKSRAEAVPLAVAAWIGAAYWFTASTSFANPAVTVARMLSDTFAGIRPIDAPGFIAAQLIGAALGAAVSTQLFGRAERAH
ncbi:MAG: MIP/aquaporin family protein [Myxococcaceae bacterium]